MNQLEKRKASLKVIIAEITIGIKIDALIIKEKKMIGIQEWRTPKRTKEETLVTLENPDQETGKVIDIREKTLRGMETREAKGKTRRPLESDFMMWIISLDFNKNFKKSQTNQHF